MLTRLKAGARCQRMTLGRVDESSNHAARKSGGAALASSSSGCVEGNKRTVGMPAEIAARASAKQFVDSK